MVAFPTRNDSSRGVTKITHVVLHSTAGGASSWAGEEQGTVGWFQNPDSGASSHVVVPRTKLEVWRFVPDGLAAWTVERFNPSSLNLEFVHRAPRSSSPEERVTDSQLERGAWQVARWCKLYGVPAERASWDVPGIIGHGDLPPVFNTHGHVDPGLFFDWDRFFYWLHRWLEIV